MTISADIVGGVIFLALMAIFVLVYHLGHAEGRMEEMAKTKGERL